MMSLMSRVQLSFADDKSLRGGDVKSEGSVCAIIEMSIQCIKLN